MNKQLVRYLWLSVALVATNFLSVVNAHENPADGFLYGDPRPDAPALAYRGDYPVGVRTVDLVNPDQLDILNYSAADPNPRYDRSLKVEIWYPAVLGTDEQQLTTYQDALGSGPGNPDRPVTPFDFFGRAARDAQPDNSTGAFPLVIVSHGYPGSRVLLSYLTENIASKGYVVVAIDHTESTHADKVGFSSTMLNRPLDINFVLGSVANSDNNPSLGFLQGMANADQTALIGYSMGGYGSLVAAGAGITKSAANIDGLAPGGVLNKYHAGSEDYENFLDDRIRAVVLFAPWGGSVFGPVGLWDAKGLRGMDVPSLFIVGNMDRTAPYAGVQSIFDNATSSDRYMLLYQGGIHEVAVNPTPPEAFGNYAEFIHYQEPAWDNRRTNNVNQHFINAFLGMHFKFDETDYPSYLNLMEPIANDSPRTDDGTNPKFWKGFTDWTAVGLEMHHLSAN